MQNHELDTLSEESCKEGILIKKERKIMETLFYFQLSQKITGWQDSSLIMQLLRDKLTLVSL
jgi:hypothetical protein